MDERIDELIARAKWEDGDGVDVTSSLLPDPGAPAVFHLIVESPGVWAGQVVVGPILRAYAEGAAIGHGEAIGDEGAVEQEGAVGHEGQIEQEGAVARDGGIEQAGAIEHEWAAGVGDGVVIGSVPAHVLTLRGPVGLILTAERVLLNFLQRLCGVATMTRRFVDSVAGTSARITDTRKTTPGWRVLEKYAVRCGGGMNHRAGLHDAVLIKDNHLFGVEPGRVAPAVFEMLNKLSVSGAKPDFIEVEADSLDQVEQLLKVVGIDVILLDNFTVDQLVEAVAMRERAGLADAVAFEASGGVTLETVGAIAATGVERISVGAITHSAPALPMKLERVR